MADSDKPGSLQDVLKPFYQRASEAADRLSRLEAALAREGNKEHLEKINQLESEVELAKSKLVSEQEKAQQLAMENSKLQYRIVHLLRALQEADRRSEK